MSFIPGDCPPLQKERDAGKVTDDPKITASAPHPGVPHPEMHPERQARPLTEKALLILSAAPTSLSRALKGEVQSCSSNTPWLPLLIPSHVHPQAAWNPSPCNPDTSSLTSVLHWGSHLHLPPLCPQLLLLLSDSHQLRVAKTNMCAHVCSYAHGCV